MTSQTKILNKSHLIGGFLLQKIDPLIPQNYITNLENIIIFSKPTFLNSNFKNKKFWDLKKNLNSLPPFLFFLLVDDLTARSWSLPPFKSVFKNTRMLLKSQEKYFIIHFWLFFYSIFNNFIAIGFYLCYFKRERRREHERH